MTRGLLPVGSDDLELLVAEVGDALERAAESGDEPVQDILVTAVHRSGRMML